MNSKMTRYRGFAEVIQRSVHPDLEHLDLLCPISRSDARLGVRRLIGSLLCDPQQTEMETVRTRLAACLVTIGLVLASFSAHSEDEGLAIVDLTRIAHEMAGRGIIFRLQFSIPKTCAS